MSMQTALLSHRSRSTTIFIGAEPSAGPSHAERKLALRELGDRGTQLLEVLTTEGEQIFRRLVQPVDHLGTRLRAERSEHDGLDASIGGNGPPLDEAALFQAVDQPRGVRSVAMERLGERARRSGLGGLELHERLHM